jgi:hypothetical protein
MRATTLLFGVVGVVFVALPTTTRNLRMATLIVVSRRLGD